MAPSESEGALKKTRFTEEQMVTILREADTKPVPDVAKKHGVSGQTIYSWRKHLGSLEPSDVKRLRQLEQENGRLKKMVADRDLEIDRPQGDHAKKNGSRTRGPLNDVIERQGMPKEHLGVRFSSR